HPAVQSCAVVAQTDEAGGKRLVAYFVATAAEVGSAPPSAPSLRAHLAATLPEFMVPARYLQLDRLPVTANGKLDRRALPVPDRSRPELAAAYEPPANAPEQRICAAFGAQLDIDRIGRHDNFFELGGNSLLAIRLLDQLRADRAGATTAGSHDCIAATLLFRNPTPATLAAALDASTQTSIVDPARLARAPRLRDAGADDDSGANDPIAIIAMAGRFPGAADVETFWQNLCEGRDTITAFRPDELDPAISAAVRNDPAYVAARGVIDGVEQFDAAFFGISPKEAELMDPQQRIFLELCWECLERGGHVPDATPGPVGVFAGMYNATYYQRHVVARPDLIDKIGAFQVMLDNEKDYITTRVAHKLNLTGPTLSIHSACSTSLVAICQAVDSLRAGRCDMALAGGVSVTCPPRSGYLYQDGAMLSPDGHTRTFDANAQGTVFSDGAAVVLLKRLSDAIADGNPVYALIRGGAINNDGGHKASFTAPSSEGQAAVIAMAHDNARVDARSISYVETHGTATPLGDPIEIEGLTRAFRRSTADTGFCRIGSVKSNVGHMVIAAGAGGVIKTALALSEGRIPASVHFESPNPAIDFAGSPFVVNAAMSDWHRDGAPRRAGVSSFGVGGTNAHAVLEEAPALPPSEPAVGPQLLVLSARTPAALGQAVARLADHLEAQPEANIADVAWTLAVGRKAFAHRVAATADDVGSAIAALRAAETNAAAARSRPARMSDVVFLFPGQGATYAGMGRGLYDAEPAFRVAFDECVAALPPAEWGFDLRACVFGDDPQALLPTAIMQPATFAIEYSLARLWMSQGVVPAAMMGHSVGEFVAATLAGVFAPADAMRLVARRGALMQAQPAGGMLSVRLALDALLPRLPAELSLAAENASGACVVAGPLEAIARFQAQLEADGVACRALRTSHAFHSAMMEPVVAPFLAEVVATARDAPRLPLVSTATGDWLDGDTAMSAEYWARHLREPVRFAAALGRVLDVPARVLLEVGPRATLSTLARQHPGLQKQHIVAVATLADAPATELADFRRAAGQLWCRGVPIDPAVFDRRARRHRLRLPTYPFERQRYWIDAAVASSNIVPHPAATAALETSMLHLVTPPAAAAPVATAPSPSPAADRRPRLVAQVRDVFEDVAGYDLADADTGANFIELGLDSLMLTQVALQLQKSFPVKVTFRQLMGDCASLDRLAEMLDSQLPPDVAAPGPASAPTLPPATPSIQQPQQQMPFAPPMTSSLGADGDFTRQLIAQQMQLMAQQLALLAGNPGILVPMTAAMPLPMPMPATAVPPAPAATAPLAAPAAPSDPSDDEAAVAHTTYDVKKAFGAIARIDTNARFELTDRQRGKLDAFIARYVARTRKSKEYTQAHRSHMADPRVVNGFRPLLKEIVYQIVIERSKGAHLHDLDGNDYVDALNGFGMSLFGWQPDFVLEAVRGQLDLGYEIGPQHPLAGEVARLVCEVTGHDRAALCNTGSEAVLGALRIARTVTGRETVVLFTGSYHGIVDEMIVRGTKKLRAVPAAPGILRNTSEHVLVLDYGTPESMRIIRERAHEIAAVLVEPVQSRRPDFQPREFLHELRQVTSDAGALLVFDEVVTGFRAHPAGAQGLFGIRADIATYGKVVGGGYPIGVIAGKRDYMDALDGGHWQFGDDSVPTVGVTYFAGTFVRHPLALAAAKAVLTHIQAQGPQLQERLNARAATMADELNAFCADRGAPVAVKQFASVWKTFFLEDHPLQDLLFAMMRSRGVHILDNFPCFLTTAHSEADFQRIIEAFKASLIELQEAEFLPQRSATPRTVMDPARPAVAGARLGREPDGRPAWFAPHPEQPGKYVKVN
ncbi:MAG: type I polyketide synthase, partial [Lysobacter sp.]